MFFTVSVSFARPRPKQKDTPWKTNMSPGNQWVEDVFPIEIVLFRGHVSFRGCSFWNDPCRGFTT